MDKGDTGGTPDRELRRQAREHLQAFLTRRGLRRTRQREHVLETFLSSEQHWSAEELFAQVRDRYPGIGIATVYRTLHLFVEAGIVREREFSAGRKYYEHVLGETQHHHHLICTNCGTIIEFECPEEVDEAEAQVAALHGYRLTGHSHELFGLCSACADRGELDTGGTPR